MYLKGDKTSTAKAAVNYIIAQRAAAKDKVAVIELKEEVKFRDTSKSSTQKLR